MGTLLTAEEIRDFVLTQGLYTTDNCPALEGITFVIGEIENWMSEWLNEDFTAQDYLDELHPVNPTGHIVLIHYPVTQLLSVNYASPWVGGGIYLPMPPTQFPRLIRGSRSLYMGQNLVGCNAKVSYHATNLEVDGLLPPAFKRAARQLVVRALEKTGTSGDLLFLSAPTRDTQSISLPGGLSKSYKLGAGSKRIQGQPVSRRAIASWRD